MRPGGSVYQYKTVFGTETDSLTITWLSRLGYACLIGLTGYMSYDGVRIFRSDLPFAVQLAFAGVVTLVLGAGLKLLLWRMPRFDIWLLGFTLAGTMPAIFFNFIGFYHKTGEVTIVREQRDDAQDVIRAYNAILLRESGKAGADIESDRQTKLAAAKKDYTDQLTLLERRVSNAGLLVQEEADGVKRSDTTGVIGQGDVARLREADKKRADADFTIDKKALDDDNTAKVDAINGAADAKLAHLKAASDLLDKLTGNNKSGTSSELEHEALTSTTGILDDGVSASDKIADCESLDELEDAARQADKMMDRINGEYTAATGRSLDAKGIKVENGNLFDLSIRGLLHFDFSAWGSLILAMLMDWLDTLIVFGIRRHEADGPAPAPATAPAPGP